MLHGIGNAIYYVRRQAGFVLLVCLMLALGIGLATSVYSVFYGVLLRPLPYPHAEQLIRAGRADGGDSNLGPVSYPELQQWSAVSRTVQPLAAWKMGFSATDSGGTTAASQIVVVETSDLFFGTLGVAPQMGRVFSELEDKTEGGVILSAAVWRDVFASDRQVVGKTLRLKTGSYSVIGVMPESFFFPLSDRGPAVWIRLHKDASLLDPAQAFLQVVGRLTPGATLSQAQAELTATGAKEKTRDEAQQAKRVVVEDLRKSITGNWSSILISIECGVLALWLMTTLNVLGLSLSHALARRRETATRLALGATYIQLVRQYVLEAFVLVLIGGSAGLLLAGLILEIFKFYLPSLPMAANIRLDLASLTQAGALLLTFVVIFPAAFAFQAMSLAPVDALREGGRGGHSRVMTRLRELLIVAEIGIAMILLVGAGLIIQSMRNIYSAPLGFRSESVLLASAGLEGPTAEPATVKEKRYYDRIVDRLNHLPGIEAAAACSIRPLSPEWSAQLPVQISGRAAAQGPPATAEVRIVSDEYFRVLGARLIQGRLPGPSDTEGSPMAVVVNEQLARKFFPAGDAIGSLVRTSGDGPHMFSPIVGVIGDIKQKTLSDAVLPEMMVNYRQIRAGDALADFFGSHVDVLIKPAVAAASITPAITKTLTELTGEAATIETFNDVISRSSVGDRRVVGDLLNLFAISAICLAFVGLYGLLSYSVSRSSREIAIKLALGSGRPQVVASVVRQALQLGALGAAIGVLLATQLERILGSLLFGVPGFDPLTIGVGLALLTVCCLLGSLVPARRAASIEPVSALRGE